jgi:hypothetical protein
MNTVTRSLLLLILMTASVSAGRPGDLYKEGDVVEFRIERNGKTIGTQKATCAGVRFSEDSLMVFRMETKSVVERRGRSFDLDVTCEAAYRTNGLPRDYKFDLELLNAKVTSEGRFTSKEYMGSTTRIGVTTPFNMPFQRWPVLFDNNFALQWEIAMNSIRRSPGDTLTVEAMIPQLNQLVPFAVTVQPFETMTYAGENLRVRVLLLNQANETLYIDDSGRLLKAVDKVAGFTVLRLAPGESAQIVRMSIWTMISNRLPGYLLLAVLAIGWFAALGRKEAAKPIGWIALVVSAALYWLSLQALMPVQNAYFAWAIDPHGSGGNAYITLFGSALIFAIFEMATIALPVVGWHLVKRMDSGKIAIAIGAAAGAGFGLMQAANLTQFADDGSILLKVDLLQKVALIGVCVVCGALIGLLLQARLPSQYYLIPIGIKTILNWTSAFVQKGSLSLSPHAFISLLIAAGSLLVLFLIRRSSGKHGHVQKQIKTN